MFEKYIVPNGHPTAYIGYAFLFIAAVFILWQFAKIHNDNSKLR